VHLVGFYYKNKKHLTLLFRKIRNRYNFTLHPNVSMSASFVFQWIIHNPGSNREQFCFNGIENWFFFLWRCKLPD